MVSQMVWDDILIQILQVAYLLLLPASIWGHLLYPNEKLAVTFALGLLLMAAAMPLAVALVSGMAKVVPSTGLTAILSTVATLAGLAASLARMRTRTRGLEE